MDSKSFKLLIEAGAIKRVHVIGDGSLFRVEADTQTGTVLLTTVTGKLKTWNTLDAASKWIHSLGIGRINLDLSRWQPGQKGLKV